MSAVLIVMGGFRPMEIHIIYSTDNNFVSVCATSMISVMENKSDEIIYFHVILNQVSSENQTKMLELVANYPNCRIDFCKFPDLEGLISSDLRYDAEHISISSYGRLFMESALPIDVSRILYLDCDTIILKSLCELYSADLKGKIIGGVDDCKSTHYRKVLGIDDKANYINAGVLLIDYPRWKKYRCEERFIRYIEEQHGQVHFEDQGVINAVLHDQITLLPLQNNVMSHIYDLSFDELMRFRNPVVTYTRQEVEEAKEDPTIIHFTTSFLTYGRAWNVNTNHQKKGIFQYYMQKTGFVNQLQEKQYSFIGRVRNWLVAHLPRKWLLILATFVHEYVDPLKFWLIMHSHT